ncbi:MAG: site-specific DNA-methyltransferase [Chloroflexi bacterium]|nr:site-specific DNA-methyltransferase [Chloroflexota bacterium]
MKNRIYFGDDLKILEELDDGSATLIYIKPPVEIDNLWRLPLSNESTKAITIGSRKYTDLYDQYLEFLEPRLVQARRVLSSKGTIYFHSTPEKAHYCKALLLDEIFGSDNFLNEAIWVYSNTRQKSERRWLEKHDNILVYIKDFDNYIFNTDDIDRLAYMAPNLVGKKKRSRGKLPTDTWFEELTPNGLLSQIIKASSNRKDLVVQLFAIDGSVGETCLKLGRKFILLSNSKKAMKKTAKSLEGKSNIEWLEFATHSKGKRRGPTRSEF